MDLLGTTSVIGMVHLPALPGAPGFDGDREAIVDRALADAHALAAGGVDAILVENFGDAPFYPTTVPPHVIAEMTHVVSVLERAISLPIGVNVLRNDASGALSVGAAAGGAFVRVNVHTHSTVTDQGRIDGMAHETLRLRDRIDANEIDIFADVDVKHAEPPGDRSIESETRDCIERGLADGIVVSGATTGDRTDTDQLHTVVDVAHQTDTPVLVGSGVTADTIDEQLSIADGAIVGSALKKDGDPAKPVETQRVERLVDAL